MLDKAYDPASVEQRIYARWEDEGAFRAGAGARSGGDSYCIVIPPPNVTGSLHMGHALNNTLQDILVRYKRMLGLDVLWQPGTDHAGIATQMVVERQLMERQEPDRRKLGREEFVRRIWAWKEESGGTIVNQLRRLGASCDWSRERFTMDEGLSRAVLKVFVDLYREGLIYKDKRLVNWDPVFQTAISDLEVEQREVSGHMWSFAYPLADGPVDGISEIVISTTRPETMLGDGAVAVHPSDERYRNLVGRLVRLPIAERLIPIIADEYPDPEFGTGAVKITGAHDFNDFEVARRNNIPLIPLMDAEARMVVTPENNVPAHYAGLDRYEARELVLKEIKELGFFRGEEEKIIAQPFGDRSGVVIEPMLTDQWYVNAEVLAKPAIEAVEQGRTKIVPQNWEKTYFEWMRNIQPWCISRQLWWGHQIPAWYSPDGEIFVAHDEAEARAQAREKLGRDVELTRDPDVLDTWFSSALWPFSTLGWPEETPELKRYYQTDVLVTGFDILFFWVARMMMMGLHFLDEEPFHTVYIHALVRDERGQKMSKSKGNVLDPLELIDSYSADALRFTLAAMAAQGRDIKLAPARVEGYRNFSTKLWNAARFCEMNECRVPEGFDPAGVAEPLNRWIVAAAAAAVREVAAALDAYRFNDAAAAVYRFVWNTYCDWYLELAKPALSGPDGTARDETRASAAFVLDEILKMLHPFMPFVTEELWQRTGERGSLLMLSPWASTTAPRDEAAIADTEWLIGLIGAVRSVRAEMNVPAGAQIPLVAVAPDAATSNRLERFGEQLTRLARLSAVETAAAAPEGSLQIVLDDKVMALPLKGIIDFDAERARIDREIKKSDAEIGKLESKLSNEGFLAKAPEEVVEEQRERLSALVVSRDRLREIRARLGG
ncbi:MAG: valine--tRNA ligase [Flavobacteriaceae bacterium]